MAIEANRRKGPSNGKCIFKKDKSFLAFFVTDFALVNEPVTPYMTGDSDEEVAIFTEALKVAEAEREAFLARKCGGNNDLRRRIAVLLRTHDQLGRFLEDPPTGGPSNDDN